MDNDSRPSPESATIEGMNTTPSAAGASAPPKHSRNTTRAGSPYDGLPYEDEDAYERRWGGLSEAAKVELSRSDPLTFVADHLPHRDRAEGSVVVLLAPVDSGRPVVNVISEVPRNPTAEECYRLLWPFATAAGQAYPSHGRAMIGVIHHRRGPAVPGLLDQRWMSAVHQVAQENGLSVLGVMARTASGALLPIGTADAA